MDVELELPYAEIHAELGELLHEEQLCSGVFYITVQSEASGLPVEYYIVDCKSDIISDEAKRFGVPLSASSSYLSYVIGDEHGLDKIVRYEVLLYQTRTGNEISRKELLSVAVFGMEQVPGYFGEFPVPKHTPYGQLVRYMQITPGAFAIVTNWGAKLVSISYPIWDGELSDYTIKMGLRTDYDLTHGIHDTFGDLFFSEETACLALFELSLEHALNPAVVDMAAAKNAVFARFPEFVLTHNRREITGLNDVSGMMMQMLGVNRELSGKEKNLLTLAPDAGIDYLKI